MSEPIEIVNEPLQTPPAEPAAVPEVKEFRYQYQPKDENGNNLGAPQVIVAVSPEEALDKMAAQNGELIKLNRKLNKDIRLGNLVQDSIPENAPRFDESKFQFNPEPLTAEERVQLAQEIVDPENFDKAANRIVRSAFGDPEALRVRLARLEEKAAKQSAMEEADAFRRSNPDYYICHENFESLANWMIKNGLEPVKENFQLAFDTLGTKGANVLTERPSPSQSAPVVETPAPPVAEAQPPQQPSVQPVTKKPGALGLTRDNSSSVGPAPKTGYSEAEIEKMSAEDYRKLILVPNWNKQRRAPQSAI